MNKEKRKEAMRAGLTFTEARTNKRLLESARMKKNEIVENPKAKELRHGRRGTPLK